MKNNWLEKKRHEYKYSHQDIADLVGVDRSYYTKIENGLTPSVKVAKAIASHLDFEWTLFFEYSCAKKRTKNQNY
ncbi:helix-turn-helix transcriptional regulator [Domibacillus aminovorans]|uniref:helix-turn-helix transcriptional regulator n=1 Tax=Domibacillus aminovorans TaxID=29332 RepID=UPI003D1DBB51